MGQRLRLEIDASPAYEFVLSIAAATSAGNRSAPPELVTEVRNLAGGCDYVWAHLLSVAYDTPPPRDVSSIIKQLQSLHPRELKLRLIGFYVRYFRRATPPEVMAAAADGDPAAIRKFVATSYPDDPVWQSALAALLPLTAWETRRRLLGALRRWQKFFEPRHQPDALLAEIAKRRLQARTLRAEQMVAAVMDGWDYLAEPGIDAVLLVPSQVIWPNSHVFDHQSTKLICYPVAPIPAPKDSAPPAKLLARFQGVADERRLLILRELANEELTAQEIANRLAIGLTTLLHHLDVLRESGLVSVGGDRRRTYRLRRVALTELPHQLERYLLQ
ncbi:MAG TPA: winged helix-turn-helix domain-containing protein [Candidatus Acidoferrum sp.]|jgi:DNA-binding transcriptional ArsR family regulator|nr:winged helix-turn-helix domain-containing protein [Candidatus Acidoferrum sp.]